jgi:predicted nucleotidyltransferase
VAFGSRATGRARASSDLDVGVERADRRRLTLPELGAVRDELAALAAAEHGPVQVDVVDLRAADCLLRFEVARDGRLLFEDPEGRWTAFVSRTLIDHDDIAPFLPALVAGVGRAARGGGGR